MTSIQTEDEWLSLSEAAELLGMHPATVRLWADRNELPSRRTNGGHRRFRRSDIESRLRQDAERKPRPTAQLLVQSVLGRVRFAFTDGTLKTLPWYEHFDDSALEAYRSLGRRVLELRRCCWARSMVRSRAIRMCLLLMLCEHFCIFGVLWMRV